MAVDRHHAYSWALIISSVLAVLLAWAGAVHGGLVGVVVGVLIADLLVPFWYAPYLLGRHWRGFRPAFFARELLPVAGMLSASMLSAWAAVAMVPAAGLWWYRSLRMT
jgi:hypothetical protein